MIKLSIIVPLYNSEKYIRKCLDSLLNQDIPYSDYEIIVVNDGSPDSSFEIVTEYANRNSNIILINQENQGTSGARNTGIDLSKGEFITFVDPDDYVQPNVFNQLLVKMENENIDMLRFSYVMVDEHYRYISMPKGSKNMTDYSDEIVEGKVFLSQRLGYACYVWAFFYKSTIIKDNEIYYQRGFYLDDIEWLPRVLIQAHRVTSINLPVYFYVQREGSLINAQGLAAANKKIAAIFSAIELLKMEFENQKDDCVKNWYRTMYSILALSMLDLISSYFYNEKDKYINKLRKFNLFPLYCYGLSKRVYLKMNLVSVSPKCYVKLLYFKNKQLH